jgi:uncharacterized protein with ParB-like and HNH nuclease domain
MRKTDIPTLHSRNACMHRCGDMFYRPISIREAVENVNETWYLPAIQRPFDWGERHKKESFIYKLFDSIIREYPIGTLIVWKTKKKIPFRPFHDDYDSERLTRIMDKGLWGRKDKLLIYDGQQRLQSLYSCLKFTFHNKVLCFNLLFNPDEDKGPSGFKFFEKHEDPETGYLKLNELYSYNRKQAAEFEDKVLDRLKRQKRDLHKKEELLVENNLKQLWKLFMDMDTKLLSYFPLQKDLKEKEVVSVFKRINTTGMQLTNSEILFSEIKRIQFDFEEQIWDANNKIKKMTNGFSYSPDNVLQILYLIVKGTVRVDPDRVQETELKDFVETWSKLKSPLRSFFYDFLYREFKINNERIIKIKRAMIPIIIYFYYMRVLRNHKFKDFSTTSIKNMKKYLVFSQLLDWNLQTYIDNFHKIIKSACEKSKDSDFSFRKLKNFVERNPKRKTELKPDHFDSVWWFALKVLTPNREFSYLGNPDERFNPEIDHIFPVTPQSEKDYPLKYYRWVYTVWNLQPVKGEINNLKSNQPPKEFFSENPQYLKDYDFLPTTDLNDERWLDKYAKEFIQTRKEKMVSFVRNNYGINLRP